MNTTQTTNRLETLQQLANEAGVPLAWIVATTLADELENAGDVNYGLREDWVAISKYRYETNHQETSEVAKALQSGLLAAAN
ncbi:MAG: hypothetical protein WCO60_02540 [Verrucomicrobiota bacterium]